MSFVTTQPEALAAAAGSLQGIGSALSAQNAAAAAPTTGVVPAAADEVSALAREAREAGWTANVVSVRYSAADLERLIERIMPILERSDSMHFVGPEPRVNGVHVALNKDDVELVGELLEALPDGTLVLSIMPGASFQFAAGG